MSFAPLPRFLLPGALALLAVGTAPRYAAAQEAASRDRIPASVEFALGVTTLADVTSGAAGASATLHLAPGFRVGGGIWGVLRRVDEGPVLGGSGLELGMGYGGVFAEVTLPGTPVYGRLLVGGGAATLRLEAVGSPVDTETFAVVEPGAGVVLPLPGPLSIGAGLTYRWVGGADELFLAESEDLRAFTGVVYLRLGGF